MRDVNNGLRGERDRLRRKRGAVVSTWLRPAEYDRIIKAASAREVSVSHLLRTWLRQSFKPR